MIALLIICTPLLGVLLSALLYLSGLAAAGLVRAVWFQLTK